MAQALKLKIPINSKHKPIKTSSIYIHWPFCLSKCAYCSFNSYPISALDENVWEKKYLADLESFGQVLDGKTVKTIYFGGGTPSLMPIRIIEKILSKIQSLAKIQTNAEITIETNPTSSQQCRLANFKQAGINRVSIGLQALNDADLKVLGRTHSFAEGLAALERVRNLFENYSFDLIYARPNQTLKTWQQEVDEALEHVGSHVSLYELTIEKGTKFYKQFNGRSPIEQDLAMKMHAYTTEKLKSIGLERYEISNYAKPGRESKHNLAYWNYDEYIGIGPGAHSRIHETPGHFIAIEAECNPTKWLASTRSKRNVLTQTQAAAEYILMNLRKASGFYIEDFVKKFGCRPEKFLNSSQVQLLIDSGYLKQTSYKIFPTDLGLDFVDNIVSRIIAD